MVRDSEIEYWLHREQQERHAANVATCPQARECHFMLAERFADHASSIEEDYFADQSTRSSQRHSNYLPIGVVVGAGSRPR